MKKIVVNLFAIVFLIAIGSDLVMAAGFYIPEQGTAAMGQGEAVVARGNDPSTIFHNPAGMAKLEGNQVLLGTTLIAPYITFTDGGTSTVSPVFGPLDSGTVGTETDADDKLFFPSHFYFTHRHSDTVSLGFGVFSHLGLSTEWPQDWKGRYISYKADLKTFFFNPNVALKLSPAITLAAGIQYAYSTVELKKKIPLPHWEGLGLHRDANLDLGVADGDGWGYNLGALIQVSKNNTLGINFRSPVQIHYGGQANFTLPSPCVFYDVLIGPGTCTAVGAALSDSTATTDITMPAFFSIGVANRSIDRLTLEFDLQWTGWSSFDQLVIHFDNPANPISTTNKNWNDVLAFRFGGEYKLTDALAVRMGYVYDPTPVPGETLDTLLPDADRHDFNTGIGYQMGNLGIDLAYMAVVFKDRKVGNQLSAASPVDPTTVYNQVGTYEIIAHLVGLSLTYRF